MKRLLTLVALLYAGALPAQDDLMNMLDSMMPEKPVPVYATFKSTRLVNLHTNETMRKRHLDFRIMHRFQPFDFSSGNSFGAYDFFGLDGAVMRLGIEYGITDRLMAGVGRSTSGKTYDVFGKYKLMQQTSGGKGSRPLSIDYFVNTAVRTEKWSNTNRQNLFSSRLSFVHQLIITRKLNDYVSLILSPTLVHYNLVETRNQPNDLFAIGAGGSFRLSRSTRLSLEYIPRINGRSEPVNGNRPLYHDALAIGLDIETGGHVFQLHFTNASGLIEQEFIGRNTTEFKGINSLRFGFNLSRTFSREKKQGGGSW